MAGDFQLDAEQIHGRGGDEQARHGGRGDDLGERALADQRVVGRRGAGLAIDAEAGRGVALRVEVDDEHAFADRGERGAEVDRGRGLADPALLVGDDQNARRRGGAAVFGGSSSADGASSVMDGPLKRLRTRRIAASGSSLLATSSIARSGAAGMGFELRFGGASARKDADRAAGRSTLGEFERGGARGRGRAR